MAREVFIIHNVSTNQIELQDFGVKIPQDVSIDLANFDQAYLSSEVDTYLASGDLIRFIDGVSVGYSDAFVSQISGNLSSSSAGKNISIDTSSLNTVINVVDNLEAIKSIEFDTSMAYDDSSHGTGILHWHSDVNFLTYGTITEPVHISIGRDSMFYAVNLSSSDIPKGRAVQIIDSSNNIPTVGLVDGTSLFANVSGISTIDMSIGEFGYIQFEGKIHNLDTTAYGEGDILRLDATLGGKLTDSTPSAPNPISFIGVVTKSDVSDGEILLTIENGQRLSYLPDVNARFTTADNNVLIYDGTNKYWDNIDFATAIDNNGGALASTVNAYNAIQDASISTLESSVAYIFTLPQLYTTFAYVDGSLLARDASIDVKADKTYVDASLNLKSSYVYVDGSLSQRDVSIQWLTDNTYTKTYIDGSLSLKQDTITGAASTITSSNLTANRALISNASGKVAVSAVTSTQLGYLSGVTSSIQTQLNNKTGFTYVDGSFNKRDLSINQLFEIKANEASIADIWSELDDKTSFTYVDGSLAERDSSITYLYDTKISQNQLDASLAEYVPYIGATTDLSLGIHGISVDNIQLNTSPTVSGFSEGRIYFDTNYKTAAINLDADVNLQIGQENYIYVYNSSGSLIKNGKAVYMSGTNGEFPAVGLAIADNVLTAKVLGIATHDIPVGSYGFITNLGVIHDISTNEFVNGDRLYLSNTSPGDYTSANPTAIWSFIGTVVKSSASTGSILVAPQALTSLTSLTDVVIVAPQTNQVLSWNGFEWINSPANSVSEGSGVTYFLTSNDSGITGYEIMVTAPIVEAETAEYISVINGDCSIIDSYISDASVLGIDLLDGGIWDFNTFASISPIGTGATYINIHVYTRDYLGVESSLFTTKTGLLTSELPLLYTVSSVQPSFTIDPSDRLVFKYEACTDSSIDVSVGLYHGGTTNYTHVHTPFNVKHNDLSGIQGGTTDERYHLTEGKYNVVQNTSGINTGDQNLAPYALITNVDSSFSDVYSFNESTYFKESSIGSGLVWNAGLLDVSVEGSGGGVSQTYVDGSLALRDVSIAFLNSDKVNGTGVDGRVSFWNGTKSQTSDSLFIFNSTNNRLAVGNSTFSSTDPETLLIDSGVTSSYTVARFQGTIDDYLQLEVRNLSSGPTASADVVASADLSDEYINYIDLGINSTTYNVPNAVGAALDTYLYSTGKHMWIGNASSEHSIKFFTGDYDAAANERMEINEIGDLYVYNNLILPNLDTTSSGLILNIDASGKISNTTIPTSSVSSQVTSIAASQTISNPVGIYYVTAALADVTLTIPDSATSNDGIKAAFIKQSGAFNVIITTSGGTQFIGSETSQTISQLNKGITVVSSPLNSKWLIIQDSRFLEGTVDGEFQYWDNPSLSWNPTGNSMLWDAANRILSVGATSTPATFAVDASNDIIYISSNPLVGLVTADNLDFYAGGRGAFGDSITMDRLRANAAGGVPRSLSLIDTNAVMRVWRYAGTGSDPAVEFVWGTAETPVDAANAWWDMFLDGDTPPNDAFSIRRRTGGVNAEKLRIDVNTANIPMTTTSTSTTTGALTVAGGVGVAGEINSATLNTTGDVDVGGSLRVSNVTPISAVSSPNAQIDTANGNKVVTKGGYYGQEFQYAQSLTVSTTSATTPQTKLSMTTTNLPAGTYKISVNWIWSHTSASNSALADVTLNGTPLDTSQISVEFKDTTNYVPLSRVYYQSMSGVNTIILRYWNEAYSTSISDATIELIRVS